MDRYIGLDVHAQTTTIVVMSSKGKRITQQVVETHGKTLVNAICAMAGTLHVCLEEGMHAQWICEILRGRVHEVVVIIPPEKKGAKNDLRDAWWLADQLRLGIPHKRVPKGSLTRLREAVSSYDAFTKHTTRAKLQLRFLAVSRGMKVSRQHLLNEKARAEILVALPAARQLRAQLHAELVDSIEELRLRAHKQLAIEAKKNSEVQRLMEVPGIGLIRAAQIVAAVMTPQRFRTREQFWSYCGLGIVTRSSSDWQLSHQGKMTRKENTTTRGLMPGNSKLKCAFKQAAGDVIKHYPKHPWAVAYQRAVDEGKRPNLARLTLTRKIAETILLIWKHKEAYDSTRHKIQDAA